MLIIKYIKEFPIFKRYIKGLIIFKILKKLSRNNNNFLYYLNINLYFLSFN